MKVAILGSGNVATHLSKSIIKAGYPIKQVWSRNHNNAIDFALEIGANSIPQIADLSNQIDVIILAVSDDAIESVVAQIPISNQQQLILHTSGSTSISILEKYAQNCGVLYPLQTFSKHHNLDFSSIPLLIEANHLQSEEQLLMIAKKLSQKVEKVDSENRMLIHISAVFACNFTNHFYAIAEKLVQDSNLNFDLLRPLILETAQKAMLNSPIKIQTGPAKRNDAITINKHLQLLSTYPQLQNIYTVVSQDIVKMYQASNLSHK
ncbi:oxidoreductase [Pedobacter psychrophilus]|uniref:Oxidoreductase n=1 Tax=Pedobacter psychrophilus TaxID=1826909 RepID=A0A179DJM4_9SPHI|nr:Rossmann-like and DUF2520 domain-containing protein [Pedobacter psychrophilus]OAQ40719.1 oxidoreductase [Pedobacter psychrophilus]